MGGQAGRGGWRGVEGGRLSREISDISKKSSLRVRFATLGCSTAAGLYGLLSDEHSLASLTPKVDPMVDAAGD